MSIAFPRPWTGTPRRAGFDFTFPSGPPVVPEPPPDEVPADLDYGKLAVRCIAAEGGLPQFETWLGAPADRILFFANGPTWDEVISSFQDELDEQAGNTRPGEYAVAIATGDMTLAQVASGLGDNQLRTIAGMILTRQPAGSLPVRFGWEMNQTTGDAWNAVGHEADYIAAYRRAVNLFRAKSPRFYSVWCPNWTNPDGHGGWFNPETMYPGDDVVDIIGMDVYFIREFDQDAGQTPAEVWRYKREAPYGLDWLTGFAALHAKPLAIPEWGVNADNAQTYIALMADWLRQNHVTYHGYWDRNAGLHHDDKLSDGTKPATGARFRVEYGPITITSPAARTGSRSAVTSLPLSAHKPGVTWSIPTATAGMAVSGPALLPNMALALGAHAVTVRATDERGQFAQQAMTVDMQASRPAWTPTVFGSSLKLWFDATDANVTFAPAGGEWVGRTGARKLSNATVGQRPTYVASGRNGQPSVHFAKATGQRLLLDTVAGLPAGAAAHTAVIEACVDPITQAFEEMGTWGNATSNRRAFTTNADLKVAAQAGGFHSPALDDWAGLDRMIVWTLDANSASGLYVDGGPVRAAELTPATTPSVDGSLPNPNGNVQVDVQDWMVLDRVVSTIERYDIEGYLAWHWNRVAALPAGHPFALTPPMVTE